MVLGNLFGSKRRLKFLCVTAAATIAGGAVSDAAALGASATKSTRSSAGGATAEVFVSNLFSACLQIYGNKTTVGAKVVTGSCSIPVVKKPSGRDGVWYMGVKGSSKNCVIAGDAVDGYDLSVNDCNLGYGLWEESFGALRLWNTPFCLDFENGENRLGVPVQIWSCERDQDQMWPIAAQQWSVKSSAPIASIPTSSVPAKERSNPSQAPVATPVSPIEVPVPNVPSPSPAPGAGALPGSGASALHRSQKCRKGYAFQSGNLRGKGWVKRVSGGFLQPSNAVFTFVGFEERTTKAWIQVIADKKPGKNWANIRFGCDSKKADERYFHDKNKWEMIDVCDKQGRCQWNVDGRIERISDDAIGLLLTEFDRDGAITGYHIFGFESRNGSLSNSVKMAFCKTAGVGMPLAQFTLSLSKTALNAISTVTGNKAADGGLFLLEAVQIGAQTDGKGSVPTQGRLRGFTNLTEAQVKNQIFSMSSEYAKNEVLTDLLGTKMTTRSIQRVGKGWDVVVSGRATIDSAIETTRTLLNWSETANEWKEKSKVCKY